LLKLATGTILAYSDKPLRISISFGFTMAGIAFAFGFYTVARAVLHDIPVPGWTSLITSLYFIGGLILANLGVVGIYLGKTFDETKGRPLYLIAHQTMAEGSS
jgi:dolichol-phosphate mannosyltransferase